MSRHPHLLARAIETSRRVKSCTRKPRLVVQTLEDRAVPATITVSSAADTGIGTLRTAITSANASGANDEIVFNSLFSTAQVISLATALPVFSATGGALKITGPGEALLTVERASGAATNFRVFGSNAPTLEISKMTVSGGTNFGAGLFTFGTTTLDHMVFQGATSSLGPAGGIIIGDGQTATISNSTITNNTISAANPNGGAGGVLVGTGSSFTLIDSQVTNNTVTDGNGGGIFLNPNATLIVQGSTISGNHAASAAGNSFGGGIFANSGCTISITDSTISDNTVVGGGTSVGVGGGIFDNGTANITIVGSTIANNTATGPGGGICSNPGSKLSITDSDITGNTSTAGGGVYSYYATSLAISSTTISGNSAGTGGGVRAWGVSAMSVQDSTISGNNATLAATNFPYGGGGFYLVLPYPVLFRNTTIANNTSARGGGGVMANTMNYDITFENCTIVGNSAAASGTLFGLSFGGGGLCPFNGTGKMILNNTVVAGNTNPGGGPDITSSSNTTVLNNSVVGDTTGFIASGTSMVAPGTPLGLGTLGDYGGPTQTISLLPTSPLRDLGDNSLLGAITTDQRGFSRPSSLNPTSDIGAYEIQPVTVTINQGAATADPTNSTSIVFDVAFNVPVTDFDDPSDIDFFGSSLSLGTLTATLAPVGSSQTDYTVTVTGMTPLSQGDILVKIPAGSATDIALFPNSASSSTDNKVTYDGIAPTVTINQSAGQADPATTGPIKFDVNFSEPIIGFANSTVQIAGAVGGTVTSFLQTGLTSYTVSVTGMSGEGTMTASVAAGAVTDPAGNPTAASTPLDDNVIYDDVVPTVTVNKAATQADPTQIPIIVFDVVFSEPVTGFGTGSIDLSTSTATAGTGGFGVSISGTGPAYQVTVSNVVGRGDVILKIPGAVVVDQVGHPNDPSTNLDNSVTFVHAGAISFLQPIYAFNEDTGGATVTVTAHRSGGSDGIVTADYTVTADTAHTPSDYGAPSGTGTLTWGDGITTDQTFTIPIVNDSANEGLEFINLALTNPTGGVILGLPAAKVAIAPSDGTIVNGAAVKPAKPQGVFTDADGDIATVKLDGKAGSATVFITDPDGDGHGPLELIVLAGTDATKSKLTITDKKAKGGVGNGRVTIGDIIGTGAKSITAKVSDLIGTVGVNLTSFLGSLTVANITSGGDIIAVGAPPAKPANLATKITAGVISDGTNIAITGAPLGSLTAISVGVGNISAPSVGTIKVTGKAATKAAAAIPGDFKSNMTIAGTGLAGIKNPVALKSLNVKGAATGVTIAVGSGPGTIGNVGKVSFGSFANSRLFAGYSGADDGSGAFVAGGTIAGFNTTKVGPFAHSFVIADNIKSVSLATVDPTNATTFGFVFKTSFGGLTAKTTPVGKKVHYDKKLGGTQVLDDKFTVVKIP